MPPFRFYRFRFQFQALDAVHFPAGHSGNVVRGALGTLLRRVAPAGIYQQLFEPGDRAGPSGLADWPRPFVFRAAHLDGLICPAGAPFHFDVHVFELRLPVLPYFRAAFAELAMAGLGPTRGRARLQQVEQADLTEQFRVIDSAPEPPCRVPLEIPTGTVEAVTIQFVTPTELKVDGRLAERPEFAALFARVRDRLCTLASRYGGERLEPDFRGLGARANEIGLGRCDLCWRNTPRTSSRTHQTHPLGGFTGEADYHGDLAEFLPWLQAARWTGVGRQTVWGKGEIRVVRTRAAGPGG